MHSIPVFLLMCCYTGTLSAVTKRRFGLCFPAALLSMPLILFISEFVSGSFRPGYVAVICIAAAFIPLIVFTGRKGELLRDMTGTGFIATVIAFLFFMAVDRNRHFTMWDEYSHWGVMVKEMLRLDAWYADPASRLMVHHEYPPFLSLFEMLWCRFTGGYSETGMYLSVHLFSLAMVVPPLGDTLSFSGTLRKKILPAFCLAAGFVLLVACFDPEGIFHTVYQDLALSLMFAYGFLLISGKRVFREPGAFPALVLCTAAMLITKQVGIAFVLVLWFYFLITGIGEAPSVPALIAAQAVLVAVPMLPFLAWSRYVGNLGYRGQFDLAKISPEGIIIAITDTYNETLGGSTLKAYVHALFEKNAAGLNFPLTYVAAFVAVLAIIRLLYRFLGGGTFGKRDAILLGVALTCGTGGYALVMGVLYLFCFGADEMVRLASFERYMGAWLLAEAVILAVILITRLDARGMLKPRGMVLALPVCMLIVNPVNLKVFVPALFTGSNGKPFMDTAKRIERHAGEGDGVFILSDDLATQFYVNYYADGIKTFFCTLDVTNLDLSDDETGANVAAMIFDNNDWLYVDDTSENFNGAYADRNGGERFEEGTLYRILEDGSLEAVRDKE